MNETLAQKTIHTNWINISTENDSYKLDYRRIAGRLSERQSRIRRLAVQRAGQAEGD